MAEYEENLQNERLNRIEEGIATIQALLRQVLNAPAVPRTESQTVTFGADSPEGGAAEAAAIVDQAAAPTAEAPAPNESTTAPSETAPETKSETAGNTETVGTSYVGAAKPE